MAQRSAGDDRTFLQTVAMVIAAIVAVLLVINLIKLGLNSFLDIVWLLLEVAVLGLALWWIRTRERMAWIGYVVAVLAGAMVLISVIDIGLGSFWDVLRLTLLVLVLIVAIGAVRGGSSSSSRRDSRSRAAR
jgi:membrane-associated HD superfamily phosphohydrolase